MLTADACQRLLNTQPLLDALASVDEFATLNAMRDDAAPSLDLLMQASVTIAQAGYHSLLSVIRADIARLMPDPSPVRDFAFQAAVAAAFSDLLDEDVRAALSLPWALHAVIADEA